MIVTIGLILGIILALVEEFQVQGKSLVGWAVVIGFGALLIAHLGIA